MSYDPFDHDLERGMRNRRRMLGDAWVDKSVAGATSFNADFQNFITRYAWNEVWGRPGLAIKSRRIIVMACTASLGRWEEYELHLRAALAGDEETALTPDEVKEVLMQIAIYSGVPAANTGMSIALRLLRELGMNVTPQPATQAVHTGVGRAGLTASSPSIHYTVREPRGGPDPRHTVVLCHGLGCDMMMWDELANTLSAKDRVVCYDLRGHGGSQGSEGEYSMSLLAGDAARLVRELQLGPVVFVGLSLGGMIAQALAIEHPELVKALVIANSSATYDEATRQVIAQRADTVRDQGMEAVAESVLARFFRPEFHVKSPAVVDRFRRRLITTPVQGYVGCARAVQRLDLIDRLSEIKQPTLVIGAEQDRSTPLSQSEQLQRGIAGSQLRVIDQAAHVSLMEQPGLFAAYVEEFLATLTPTG